VEIDGEGMPRLRFSQPFNAAEYFIDRHLEEGRGGKVAVRGWVETSAISALDLALKFEDAGVAAIVFTDIDRDGAMQGVNVEATAALASRITIPVIASGGVASLDDIRALKGVGIPGAIIGRALYEGRFTLADALKAAE